MEDDVIGTYTGADGREYRWAKHSQGGAGMSETLYKVLSADGRACHGGNGKWSLPTLRADGTYKPGRWMPKRTPELCASGYHLCRRQDLIHWLNETIYEAEFRGERIDGDDKIVVESARLLRPLENWTERTARLFACDCAEDALPFWERYYPDDKRPHEAIAVARRYARGEATEDELSAARSAAESARSVARSAESAAWSAAWSATESAWSVARSVARSAWSAAWSAESARSAWSAARSAAESAWSAARSAESARSAWSAARSAWSAARSAESARSAAESAWSAARSARSAAESAWSAWSAARSAAESAESARSAAYKRMTDRLFEYLEVKL